MTDWVALGAAIFAGASTIGGAFYMRGKLDGHAKAAGDKIDALGKKITALETAKERAGEDRGAQGILNANAAAAATDARAALTLASKIDERQRAHEEGCDRRQNAIWQRFDKTEERIDHLGAEIRNLALGLANKAREVPANKRAG